MADAMVLAVYMPPQLPGPGNRGALDFEQFRVADTAGGMAAHRFEHRDDVATLRAGLDGAAVHEHGGTIEARDGHGAARHVLVAAADGDEAVETFGAHHGFDGVGDHFA